MVSKNPWKGKFDHSFFGYNKYVKAYKLFELFLKIYFLGMMFSLMRDFLWWNYPSLASPSSSIHPSPSIKDSLFLGDEFVVPNPLPLVMPWSLNFLDVVGILEWDTTMVEEIPPLILGILYLFLREESLFDASGRIKSNM